MALREFQAWGPPGGPADLFTTVENIEDLRQKGGLEPGHVHLFSIRARSPIDAMQQYYRAQDWGEFKPMLDKNGHPYAADLAEFEDDD